MALIQKRGTKAAKIRPAEGTDQHDGIRLAMTMIANALFTRSALAGAGQGQSGQGQAGQRDLNLILGYPDEIQLDDYLDLYARNGIAARVVGVFPDECWKARPTVTDEADATKTSPFGTAVRALIDNPNTNPWQFLHRADTASRICHYGVLLLGFNDGKTLDKPVTPSANNRINFLRVFNQRQARIYKVEGDERKATFGMPAQYQIDFMDPNGVSGVELVEQRSLMTKTVHADRIVHLADNRLSSEILGQPAMQQVYDYLLDTRKVAGGSAEMFFRNAAPGYVFETHPNAIEPEMNREDIETEFLRFANDFQRYMAIQGMTVKSLAPQVADPTNQLTQQLTLICASLGVPLRVFLGSEAGHLASTQDMETWNGRLAGRQNDYLTPFVVRPFFDRLIRLGVLPTPKNGTYRVDWADLNGMKEKDKADIATKRVQSFLQYVSSGVETVLPLPDFLTRVMFYTEDEAAAIVRAVKANPKLYTKGVWQQPEPAARATQGGSGKRKDPSKRTGTSGKRNSQG